MMQEILDRIASMTEPQVMDQLRALEAVRGSADRTCEFLRGVSLPTGPEASDDDEICDLKAKLSSTLRNDVSESALWDRMEEALKRRLKELRR